MAPNPHKIKYPFKMLNVQNVTVSFGGETLFSQISFRLAAGDRVGLVVKMVLGNLHYCI